MNTKIFRIITVLVAFILILGAYTPGRAATPAALTSGQIINIAHFFKPPNNMDAATAANKFGTMVLTNGDSTYRDQLKANGFSSTVPEYFRSEAIQDPGNCTATPLNNQIAYKPGDFCSISQNHPDWFLLDKSGKRITVTAGGNYYRMDPGNAGWRSFFLSRVIESQNQDGWSALFLDNVEASLGKFFGNNPVKYPDEASYQAAIKGFLQYLDVNYSQKYGRPFFGNIVALGSNDVWFGYLQYLDGALTERFAVAWSETAYLTVNQWLNDMALMEQTQANGKYAILVAPGYQNDLNREKFAFASYLLISNGKVAFRYSTPSAYRDAWLYDNYTVNLGPPLGPRYPVGSLWRRDFSKGYVVVDPASHSALIQTVTSAPDAGSYDDANSNWQYGSSWVQYNGSGPTNDTVHYTSLIGDSAMFWFNGTQFTLTYTQASNRGNIDVFVDGNKITTINANGGLQWKKTYTSPTFAFGIHIAQFKFAGGAGSFIDVDAIRVLSPSAPGPGTYDDADFNWSYSGSWTRYNGSGPINDTVYYTSLVGNTASFRFNGTQFTLTYTQASNRGNIDVFVDGGKIATINANGNLQWKKTYTSPVLSLGTHTVQFKFAGGNYYMDIDAIQILSSSLPGPGIYDDANSNWQYGSSWVQYNGSGPTNDTVHYTSSVGNTASFRFNGTQFTLTYTQASNRGNIDVYLDGSKLATINANGDLQWKKTYISPVFSSGAHTVQFKFSGGNDFMDVDAIQIQ